MPAPKQGNDSADQG